MGLLLGRVVFQRRVLPCWVNVEPFDFKDYGAEPRPAPLSFDSVEDCLAYVKRVIPYTDDGSMYVNALTGAVMWSGSVLGWLEEEQ